MILGNERYSGKIALAGMLVFSFGMFAWLGTEARAQEPKPAEAAADSPVALFKQAFDQSKTAKDEKEFSQLIDLVKKGLAAKPSKASEEWAKKTLAWALNKRGELLSAAGEEEKALADFNESIGMDGSQWRTVYNRGISHAILGKSDEAAADLDKALQMNPNSARAWFNRGELRYATGDYAGAIRDYDRSLRLSRTEPDAFVSRGHAYYRQGNYNQAIADYSQAIQVNPDFAEAHVHRADAYADRGRFREAYEDYSRALRLDPASGHAWQAGGWLLSTCPDEQYREADKALKMALYAISLDGETYFKYLDTLAAAYANLGQFDKAVETQTKVVAMVPEDQGEDGKAVRVRLETYKAKKPYRDTRAALVQAVAPPLPPAP